MAHMNTLQYASKLLIKEITAAYVSKCMQFYSIHSCITPITSKVYLVTYCSESHTIFAHNPKYWRRVKDCEKVQLACILNTTNGPSESVNVPCVNAVKRIIGVELYIFHIFCYCWLLMMFILQVNMY